MTKEIQKPKFECPQDHPARRIVVSDFGLRASFGIRNSEFGSASFRFLGLALVRRALFDFLAVVQIAADGAVSAGDDFLAIGEAVGDFPIAVVANADFARPGRTMC